MERDAYGKLVEWKKRTDRRPLVLKGARQVGKTWLLHEFGRREYRNVAVINFNQHPELQAIFRDTDTERLLRVSSAVTNERILPGETLLILDEIQEAPQVLTSLKVFCENAREYHVAAAGNLPGLSDHQGMGYPAGKTDEIQLYPLSFHEFLGAMGKDLLLEQLRRQRWEEMNRLQPMLMELLRQYYFTGGMPAVVKEYRETQDLQKVREIQGQILREYDRDFSRHIPTSMVPKVRMVWNSIPSQLARDNRKFIYGAMRKGGRAKEFRDAIQWLQDAGLVYRVTRLSRIEAPIQDCEDPAAFKLFMVDLGLLGAMSGVTARQMLVSSSAFSEGRGGFIEQYIMQQLVSEGIMPHYYLNESTRLGIDFVIQKERVYPIEVKAEENLRAKSLRVVVEKAEGLKGWRFSTSPYRDQGWMVNVPLPMVKEWIHAADADQGRTGDLLRNEDDPRTLPF